MARGVQVSPGGNADGHSGARLSDSIDNSGAVIFDAASGISLEEQREILAEINAMSGGSRLVPEAAETAPAKKGFLFPLCVNIGAVLLLAAGLILLAFWRVNDENAIRESSSLLGLTERALIREIRLETDRLVGEKEKEIHNILSKLSAVDAEYNELQVSVEIMSEAQTRRAALLLVLQDEYRRALSGMEEEKAAILEDARMRESTLRAQAVERTQELSARIARGEASLDSAAAELRRLGAERDRADAAESQMAGFYALVNDEIADGRNGEALDTLRAMREFLDAPSLKGIRSLESRKQGHLEAIAAMEKALTATREDSGGGDGAVVKADEIIAALSAQNAALEQKAASLERDVAAYRAEGSELDKIIAEYAADISRLESGMAERQETLDRRDGEIENLKTEAARREQQVSELNSNIAGLQTRNDELQRQRDDIQRRMEAAIRAFTGEGSAEE